MRIMTIVAFIVKLLGRRSVWRIGRWLYFGARQDVPNDMRSNGELVMQRRLLQLVASRSEKTIVFDVGANIGDWTISLLQATMKAELIDRVEIRAFEPVPSTFDTLTSRISKHVGSEHVLLVRQALSSERGEREMHIVGNNAGTNSLHGSTQSSNLPTISVLTNTVDTYCKDESIETIHYLKCDTEGHDVEVMTGAMAMLNEGRVMVFQFEYNHRWVDSRHYLKDAFELVEKRDYIVGKITPSGVEIYSAWHPELERFIEGNYLFLHKKVFSWFKTFSGRFDNHNTYG